MTACLTFLLFLALVLSLTTGGLKEFYKWVGERAFERIDGIFGEGLFFGKIFLLIEHDTLGRSWFASIISTSI